MTEVNAELVYSRKGLDGAADEVGGVGGDESESSSSSCCCDDFDSIAEAVFVAAAVVGFFFFFFFFFFLLLLLCAVMSVVDERVGVILDSTLSNMSGEDGSTEAEPKPMRAISSRMS